MNADRYFTYKKKIGYYYSLLESFCNTYNIPSYFILNVDEECHEDYSDSKKERMFVTQETKGSINYPFKRSNTHTTFIACITADGSYLKPLIVIKRKTIEARVFRVPIFDKLYIAANESGFITTEIFDDWVNKIFISYIDSKRKEMDYTGPAVLILDGWSCHYTPNLYRLCTKYSIKIFFLLPHSSNLSQPLDLVVFHLHKDKIIYHIKLDSDDLDLCEKLRVLYDTFQTLLLLNTSKEVLNQQEQFMKDQTHSHLLFTSIVILQHTSFQVQKVKKRKRNLQSKEKTWSYKSMIQD